MAHYKNQGVGSGAIVYGEAFGCIGPTAVGEWNFRLIVFRVLFLLSLRGSGVSSGDWGAELGVRMSGK